MRIANRAVRLDMSVYGLPLARTVSLARLLDGAGVGCLWVGEHLVSPLGGGRSAHPSPTTVVKSQDLFGDSVALDDPLLLLAACGWETSRIELGTAIYLAPLRSPAVTARALATLERIVGPRVTLGIGAGWVEEEFDAAGVPFGERFSRMDEGLDVLRLLMRGTMVEHHGRYWDFDPLRIVDTPLDVPLVLGGNGPRALKRAGQKADGWFCSGTTSIEEGLDLLSTVKRHAADHGRSTDFRTHIRIPDLRRSSVEVYASAGVTSVVVRAMDLIDFRAGDEENVQRVLAIASGMGFENRDGVLVSGPG